MTGETRTFATGLAPVVHPRDVERDPRGAALWEEFGPAITVRVDDLEHVFIANPTGAIMPFDLPPEHTADRSTFDAKVRRGELAIVPDGWVDVIETVHEHERRVGRHTETSIERITTYRLRDGAPAPVFHQVGTGTA